MERNLLLVKSILDFNKSDNDTFFTRNLEFKAHKEILIQGAPTPLSDCPGQVETIILVWTCKPLT